MNYRQTIGVSIEYIEIHIQEDLSAREIAAEAGYSLYHFCRVFAAIQGMPVMDYVRRRRLSLARGELLRGRKVIDIALDYGFDTAGGFSKAFSREFGYSPCTYLARISGMDATKSIKSGGYTMQPIIKEIPAFKVAGYGIQTNISSGFMKDIAAYWENYEGENLENKMYQQLQPPKHGEVGLCAPSGDEGGAIYLLGVIVEDFSKVTPDMLAIEVSAAKYAIFTTPQVDLSHGETNGTDPFGAAIKATWKAIFEEWFPNSGFTYDEGKMDFEFYDERCHARPDSTMEIYVPIK